MTTRESCAGAVILDDHRRLLLIRRGHAPAAGSWSIPGGRCEPQESEELACVREVREETGLTVRVERLAGRVEREGRPGTVYDIADFVCAVEGGELRSGDDADDARWVTGAELGRLELSPGLLGCLTEWDLLPD